MSIHAALLPSLQATYCMQQVSSEGVTGAKANFQVHLSYHHLAFTTKIQDLVSGLFRVKFTPEIECQSGSNWLRFLPPKYFFLCARNNLFLFIN